MNAVTSFKSFAHMLQVLPDDQACRNYLEQIRWNGIPVCPHCATQDEKHYQLKTKGVFKGMYKCRSCKERFTVTIGTMFEGSPIPLRKWFIALYIFTNHKKGISSHQLARDLGVTQKTAWFMLHRLREAFMDKDCTPMGGEGVVVETDSTIVGGKTKNMHMKKRVKMATGFENKMVVTAYVERSGKMRMDVVNGEENEQALLRKHVCPKSALMTDSANTYKRVGKEYAFHGVVDHTTNEYVKDKVIHTNTVEGAFSHFDRMIIGIYHQVTAKHLQAYCNENAFRYNSRKATDKQRFDVALMQTSGVKLEYNKLIGKPEWEYRTAAYLAAKLPTPKTGYEHLEDVDPNAL